MKKNNFLVTENYYPKEEHYDEVMNMIVETSIMIKEQDGALMYMSLKPEQKNGPITAIILWESREKFTNFMKSEQAAKKFMKSGLSKKVKEWTSEMKSHYQTVEQTWQA